MNQHYVIRNDHGKGVYFKRISYTEKDYEGKPMPVFTEDIENDGVFDTAYKALCVMGYISSLYPQMGLSLVPVKRVEIEIEEEKTDDE